MGVRGWEKVGKGREEKVRGGEGRREDQNRKEEGKEGKEGGINGEGD